MSNRHALRVVLYHHLAVAECDLTRSLGVTTHPDVFEKHIDHYTRNYNIVDLHTVLDGNLPERPLLITFDDAYRSVLDVATPALADRNLPAVLFANTAPLDNRMVLFDNLLCWISNTFGLTALCNMLGVSRSINTVGELITGEIAGLSLQDRSALRQSLLEHFQIDESDPLRAQPYLQAADLRTLADHGFAIGCHTADHVHGRHITLGSVRSQLMEPMELLETLTGQPCRAFSYPYGDAADVTELVEGVMRAGGCDATFLVEGRLNDGHRDLHRPLFRVSPKARDTRRLAVELEVMPRLRPMRDQFALHRRAA